MILIICNLNYVKLIWVLEVITIVFFMGGDDWEGICEGSWSVDNVIFFDVDVDNVCVFSL